MLLKLQTASDAMSITFSEIVLYKTKLLNGNVFTNEHCSAMRLGAPRRCVHHIEQWLTYPQALLQVLLEL